MNDTSSRLQPLRPRWAWLFFAHVALMLLATVLATTNHLPVTALKHAPFDKVGHLCAWGALAFLAMAFFGRARRGRVLVTVLVVATLEELSQRAFPTRTFDLGDLAMNVTGIVLAALIWFGPLEGSRAPRDGLRRRSRLRPTR